MQETLVQYITENEIEITEEGIGRPKLMKHELIKTIRGYVITNLSNNNSYFVTFSKDDKYEELNKFLIKVKALDERQPLSITGIDSNYINQQLETIGRVVLWIPNNQLKNLKTNANKMYYENVDPNVESLNELKGLFEIKVKENIENVATLSELENKIIELEEKLDNK